MPRNLWPRGVLKFIESLLSFWAMSLMIRARTILKGTQSGWLQTVASNSIGEKTKSRGGSFSGWQNLMKKDLLFESDALSGLEFVERLPPKRRVDSQSTGTSSHSRILKFVKARV